MCHKRYVTHIGYQFVSASYLRLQHSYSNTCIVRRLRTSPNTASQCQALLADVIFDRLTHNNCTFHVRELLLVVVAFFQFVVISLEQPTN